MYATNVLCVLCFGGSGEPWQDSRSYATTASAVLALCIICAWGFAEGSAPQALDFQVSVWIFPLRGFLRKP